MRLLPDDPELGWTPFAHLIYAAFFAALAFVPPVGRYEIPLTFLGLVVFLALYFRGFWVRGRAMLGIILGMTVLGLLFVPVNWGASTFFIYAGAFACRAGPPRRAVLILAALVAVALTQAWWLELPPWVWVPPLVFVPIVGGLNIHYSEIQRTNRQLRLSQEEVTRLARVAERERIARDLHDLLGHSLSVITLKSELAARLAERDPPRAAGEMRDVERISRQALAEVRGAVSGYRGTTLEAELESARAALEAARVRFELYGKLPTLEPLAESALALALREAVTNVVRHARAGRCEVRLETRDGEARMEIVDDGLGGSAPEGSGLAGMRERIASLGGRLERSTERGTRLAIALPLAGGPLETVS